jgi:hypothetical protein
MNMLEVIVRGADGAARRDRPPAEPHRPLASGRGVRRWKWSAGPFRSPSANRSLPCPFCGTDPPLAAQIAGRFIVGCESDDCHVNPQVSGQSLGEAWARWNYRHT